MCLVLIASVVIAFLDPNIGWRLGGGFRFFSFAMTYEGNFIAYKRYVVLMSFIRTAGRSVEIFGRMPRSVQDSMHPKLHVWCSGPLHTVA